MVTRAAFLRASVLAPFLAFLPKPAKAYTLDAWYSVQYHVSAAMSGHLKFHTSVMSVDQIGTDWEGPLVESLRELRTRFEPGSMRAVGKRGGEAWDPSVESFTLQTEPGFIGTGGTLITLTAFGRSKIVKPRTTAAKLYFDDGRLIRWYS